jgi:hypothetical protein
VTFADLGTVYTDNVTEGTSLYFSNARAKSAVETTALANLTVNGNVAVNSNLLYINSSNTANSTIGRIGIGTDQPNSIFHIKLSNSISNFQDPLLRLEQSFGNHQTSFILMEDHDNNTASKAMATMDLSTNAGLFNIVAGAYVNQSTYYYGSSRGACRIGFHDNILRFYTANLTNGQPTAGNVVGWYSTLDSTNTYFVVYTNNGTERLRIDDAGNLNSDSGTLFVDAVSDRVGIGTTTPPNKLSVVGNISASTGWAGTTSAAGKLGGTVMPFVCERNGVGAIGQIMSFGNGASTGIGLRMPFTGKLILATLQGTYINGNVTLDAYLNGVTNSSYRLSVVGTNTNVGNTQNWETTPLTFNAGDTLGWYLVEAPTGANTYNVSFYVVYD